jgi:DNA-directed RNA polymerase subunit RPC12/RpoP
MAQCPKCGSKTLVIMKEWDYAAFHVKNLHCKLCNRNFKAYFKEGQLSHIIDNNKISPRTRILRYLKEHNSACTQEIATALGLEINDILRILAVLEQKGRIERLVYMN